MVGTVAMPVTIFPFIGSPVALKGKVQDSTLPLGRALLEQGRAEARRARLGRHPPADHLAREGEGAPRFAH